MLAKENELGPYFANGTAEVVVRLIEEVLSSFVEMLADIEVGIDEIENSVLKEPRKDVVEKIFRVNKTLIYFHKAVATNSHILLKIKGS